MKANRISAAALCCVLVAALAIGGGVYAYAAQNPGSQLGQLLFSATAEPSNDTTYWAISEDGTARPMTKEEFDAFATYEGTVPQGGVSADGGKTVMSPGTSTSMPLVIEDDGTVREMTSQEMAELEEICEFSASAENEVVDGTFGE